MAVKIHPQAVVSAKAHLGENVEVGPFAVIYDNVRIGDNCRIFNGASIGSPPQDLKYAGETTYLEIGSNNVIREFVTMSTATGEGNKTIIGDNNLFMAYAHVAHDCIVGSNTVFANCATLAGHVEVADNVVIGGLSAVHQFCKIGRNVMIAGMSKVLQDIPPFTLVEGQPVKVRGINSVGLRRSDMPRSTINTIKQAIKILCHEGLSVPTAVERIKKEIEPVDEVKEILDFVSRCERGLAV